jgi:hypothetical protein
MNKFLVTFFFGIASHLSPLNLARFKLQDPSQGGGVWVGSSATAGGGGKGKGGGAAGGGGWQM